jgi:excisionase family DNA binding protein
VQPLAVDVREAARMLSVSPRTIRRMLSDGRLSPLRIGRAVRISVRSLEILAQPSPRPRPESEIQDALVQTSE